MTVCPKSDDADTTQISPGADAIELEGTAARRAARDTNVAGENKRKSAAGRRLFE
jgi:hypothetical protein